MKSKSKEKDLIASFAQSVCEDLFKHIGIDANISCEFSESNEEKSVSVQIDSQSETGLLIGAHGATLNAIQVFLGMALRQKFNEWVRVSVNIGDWKEKQEEQLTALADQAVQRARSTGEPQRLYNLSPSARRVIHMYLLENKEVQTTSEGEGEERYLVISLK